MIERVSSNGKTIVSDDLSRTTIPLNVGSQHDLMLLLERDRGLIAGTPHQAQVVTLSRELSVWNMRRTGDIPPTQLGLPPGAVVASSGWCREST